MTARASRTRPAAHSPTSLKKAPRAGTSAGLRHIARQENTPKTAAGWKVSVTRRGKTMHKYFADSKYGGKTKGLREAKAWHEQVVKSSSGVDYVLWRRETRSRSNSSGIIGVGRYRVRYGKKRCLVWEAYWQDADGKRRCRRFFISTHGEKAAKALAHAARREAITELRRELIRRGEIAE